MTVPTPPGPTWNPESQMYDYPSGQPSAPPHVGQPYTGHPEPQGPRKIWPARHPVWTGIGALAVLALAGGIIGSSGSTSNPRTDVAAVPSASPEPRITATESADGVQETTPPPPELTSAPAPKPKAWHTVATLGGSANKRGAAFALHGGQARLSYTARDISGLGSVLVLVYVVEEGSSLAADGGFPEVTVTQPGPGSTELANPPGRYYLEVNTAGTRWTVTVQELS